MRKNRVVVDTNVLISAFVSGIASFVSEAKLVVPKEKLFICRDTEDNMLLECCLAAKADFLVTGDKDLLEIKTSRLPKQIRNLKIITPSQRRFGKIPP